MKNPNKKAGNWGALKNKPQNQVYFKTGGKVKVTAGGEKHVIYKKTTKRGEGKVGNIMVNHPTKDKGIWDTIDLTKKAGAKTIQQGVAATKKWHRENPYNDMKKQLTKKEMGGSKTDTPPKVKTRTVTTNPGGYSKTIVKTKTINTPGKQANISTTKRRLTAKGAAYSAASEFRKAAYGAQKTIGDKLSEMKSKRAQKTANPSPKQQLRAGKREWRASGRPSSSPAPAAPMKRGGSIKKKK